MSDPLSEDADFEKALKGDQAAFARLFDGYRDRLRRMVVLRMDVRVRPRFDASDVVQEAFVEAVRALPKYVEEAKIPLFLWLRMVTGDRLAKLHRTHLGTAKRNAGREVALGQHFPDASSVYLADQLAGQFTSVDHGLKQQDTQRKLEDALNSMDPNDREIIAMRHFEELSTEEISLVLDMTRSGVLKRYTRAIRKLSGVLGGQLDFGMP